MTGFMMIASVRHTGTIGVFELVRFKVIAVDKENALYLGHILIEERGLESGGIIAHRLDQLTDAPQNDIIMMVASRWL